VENCKSTDKREKVITMRFQTAAALGAISVFLALAISPAAQAQSDWWNHFTAQAPAVDQSGHREWAWKGTDSLRYGGSGHLRYEQGGAPRIIVTGDPDEVANIEVDGGTIRRRDTPGYNFNFGRADRKLEILVQGVTLNNFDLAGSGNMDLGRLQRDTLDLRVHGSGTLNAEGQAKRLKLQVDGSGRANLDKLNVGAAEVTVTGSGSLATAAISESVNIHVTGSGKAKVGDIGKKADVHITGSGDAILGRVEDVSARITGSGTARLASQPQHSDYSFTGSGKVVLVGADGKTTELAGADMERARQQREREQAQRERQRQREDAQAERDRERERERAQRDRDRSQN
jgi:hypothetical protein